MDSTTANVPEAIREQAKQRALKIISTAPGAISFVRTEELDCQSLFVPVCTVLRAGVDDFHSLSGGVKMPKSYYTNMIAEATGVNILDVRVTKAGPYIWQGHAEGERRMPDGSMRKGAGEYEFNAEQRAEEDFLKDASKYPSDIAKRKHVLEYARYGMQRASSGARLALIRYLAGIPTGFTQETIQKAMIFLRIDRNVDGVLADPGLRSAALDRMLGATETVFGSPKQIDAQTVPRTVDVESGEIIEQAPAGDLFPEEAAAPEPEKSPVESLKEILSAYKQKIPPAAKGDKGTPIHSILDAAIANPAATEKEINGLVDRCAQYCQTHGGTP